MKEQSKGDQTPVSAEKPRASAVLQAARLMVAFLAVLWIVQIVDSVSGYPLLRLGIDPRSIGKLEDIATAPFVHVSYDHLIGNTVPLAVLGFIVAVGGTGRFLVVTGFVIVVSGVGVWLVAPSNSDTVGASGVIFGYFGYLVARGFIERRVLEIVIAAVVGILYWTMLSGIIPDNPHVSWQAHVFGLVGGAFAARLFRRREASGAMPQTVSV